VSPPRGGLAALLESAADAVASATAELNRLDGFAGDGDLGITMSEAARALKEVLADNQEAKPEKLLAACGAASGPTTINVNRARRTYLANFARATASCSARSGWT